MSKVDKTLIKIKEKKSGFLWVFLGIGLLIIVVPIVIYGLLKACWNGVLWITDANTRKYNKLVKKRDKIAVKQEIRELTDEIKTK